MFRVLNTIAFGMLSLNYNNHGRVQDCGDGVVHTTFSSVVHAQGEELIVYAPHH